MKIFNKKKRKCSAGLPVGQSHRGILSVESPSSQWLWLMSTWQRNNEDTNPLCTITGWRIKVLYYSASSRDTKPAGHMRDLLEELAPAIMAAEKHPGEHTQAEGPGLCTPWRHSSSKALSQEHQVGNSTWDWEGACVRVLKSKERQAWSSKFKTGYQNTPISHWQTPSVFFVILSQPTLTLKAQAPSLDLSDSHAKLLCTQP